MPHVQQYATRLDPVWVRRIAKAAPPPWGPMGYFTYKRTYARRINAADRTEQLHETLERSINAVLEYGGRFTNREAEALFLAGYTLQGLPGGRMLWQLGTPTVARLGGDSLFNCWWTETRGYEDFCFAFDRSMLGGGVGFEASAARLPVVLSGGATRVPHGGDFSVPDSREGWVELLHRVYRSYFVTGGPFTYDTCLVRPAGSPIHGFGGTASGPEPLAEGVAKLCALLSTRVGRRLSSVDVVDVHTIQGEVVKSGNVRRTALIGVGSPADTEYLRAKRWDLAHVPDHRAFVNLTVQADDIHDLHPDYWHGFDAEGEQFGLMNHRLINAEQAATERRWGLGVRARPTGVNPCVPGDTRILTDVGYVRIDSRVGLPTTVWNGVEWSVVTPAVTGHNQPLVKVSLSDGTHLTCTPTHGWYLDGGTRVEAAALQPGAKVEKATMPVVVGGSDMDDAYLHGFYCGDGFDHAGRKYIWLYSDAKKRCLSGETEVSDGRILLRCPDTLPSKFEVPLDASLQSRLAWFAGLVDSDGCAVRTLNGACLQVSSVDRDFLLRVRLLLTTLGVQAKVATMHEAQTRLMPDGKGGLKEYECQTSYRLLVNTTDACALKRLGLPSRRVSIPDTTPQRDARRFVTVVSVADGGVADTVYCFTESMRGRGTFEGVVTGQCAEIHLAHREPCCLTELFAPRLGSLDAFVTTARLLYRVAKTCLQLPFADPETQAVVTQNQRIGMGVTGIRGAKWTDADYQTVYQELRAEDRRYSVEIGAAESVTLTTVKPSGTLSLLPGVQPGIHGDVAENYIRRIRIATGHPLIDAARAHGYYVETALSHNGNPDPRTQIVSFPVSGGIKAGDAVEQLETQARLQRVWSDNCVSATVTFSNHEVPAIKAWLAENYRDRVKTTSFMRDSGHGFVQTPYEPVSADLYRHLASYVRPMLDVHVDRDDYADEVSECASGACPSR